MELIFQGYINGSVDINVVTEQLQNWLSVSPDFERSYEVLQCYVHNCNYSLNHFKQRTLIRVLQRLCGITSPPRTVA